MRKRRQGFTLVELMVVAVIVAILAAVAIPLMSANRERAMATEGQAGCGTVQTAVRMHIAENGTHPGAVANVTTLPGLNAGDLDGVYFNDASYGVSAVSGGSYTITATGRTGGAAAGRTVILTLPAGTWSGTLLN